MNCSSARSSRASAPFNTTKRAPDSFAAASKSMSPSASPISKCSFGVKPSGKLGGAPMASKLDIVVFVLAVGRVVEWQVWDRRQLQFQRCRRLPLRRLQFRHGGLKARDLGPVVFGRDRVLARHRQSDLLGRGVSPLLRGLKRQDRRPALFIERNQQFRAGAKPAAPQPLVKSLRVLADRSDIVHDLILGGRAERPRRRQELRPQARP